MPRRFTLIALLVLISISLSGCGGWYLRGTNTNQLPIKRVFVSSDSSSYLYSLFLQQLSYSGISVVSQRDQADAVIELRGEQYDRRVLSVDDETGKVREMELGLQVEITVRTPGGSLIAAPDLVNWEQDFVFDEASLLGTEEVDTTIRYELAKDAARALILRLETIDFSRVGQHAS
jgi:outer membrane lipopolysaccharide assembly protein LptE/RlpB